MGDPFKRRKWKKQRNGNRKFLFLLQNEKDFILKVWRKTAANQINHDMHHMAQDEIIGFCTIDLNSLSSETIITGFHNIIDSSGHVSGQIKVKQQ